MITLAFDSASDRCSVAASDGTRKACRELDGARRHAAAMLTLIGEVLDELGCGIGAVERLLTGDGPGSFTGLRVAASVAKAIAWGRTLEWRVAPSLLIRAAGAEVQAGTVIALSDALRGELYAGCWRFSAEGIAPVGGPPRAMRPADLAAFGEAAAVVGTVPASLLGAVEEATGRVPEARWPDARQLLLLADRPGGTLRVTDPSRWEPEYGRPAEAQAVWERTHGRQLPPAPGIIR